MSNNYLYDGHFNVDNFYSRWVQKCDDGGGSCAVPCYGRVAKSTLLSVVILRAAVLGPAGARAQQPRVLAILVMWTCLISGAATKCLNPGPSGTFSTSFYCN